MQCKNGEIGKLAFSLKWNSFSHKRQNSIGSVVCNQDFLYSLGVTPNSPLNVRLK